MCKPDPSLHQNLLDILNDHNLTQVIDKPTRNDRTLETISQFVSNSVTCDVMYSLEIAIRTPP
jgi:hypothetical protein